MVNQHEEVKKEIHKLLGELWLDNDQRLFQWLFNYTELGKDHNSEFDKKMWVRDPFYYSDELTLCYLYAYKYNKKPEEFNIRADGRIEWVCKHGVGHTVFSANGDYTHGCDGCCEELE